MRTLAGQNKAFAVAAIAIEKGVAIARTIMETEVAATAALTPPPLGLGPVAGKALAAEIRALGKISVGLIAAQGIAEGVSTTGGMGPGGVSAGTAGGPPIQTWDVGSGTATSQAQQPQAPAGPTINFHIYGNVVDHDKFAREMVPSIRKAISDGV